MHSSRQLIATSTSAFIVSDFIIKKHLVYILLSFVILITIILHFTSITYQIHQRHATTPGNQRHTIGPLAIVMCGTVRLQDSGHVDGGEGAVNYIVQAGLVGLVTSAASAIDRGDGAAAAKIRMLLNLTCLFLQQCEDGQRRAMTRWVLAALALMVAAGAATAQLRPADAPPPINDTREYIIVLWLLNPMPQSATSSSAKHYSCVWAFARGKFT